MAPVARSYKPKKPTGPSYLGRKEWEKLHGKGPDEPGAYWVDAGWTWQPARCAHPDPHHIRSDERTRKGRS